MQKQKAYIIYWDNNVEIILLVNHLYNEEIIE